MKYTHSFKKTKICVILSAMVMPNITLSAPLDFSQLPPGSQAIPPAPNVIVTVDDSGSMAGSVGGGDPQSKMFRLREALAIVFNDKLLLPDGKIRLAWQSMHNNGNSPGAGNLIAGAVNSMKNLDDLHRTNFLSFAASLSANNITPSHKMMAQAYTYMRTGKGINSPWAFKPGIQEIPYLGCRRSYHIFMTDGAWNGFTAGVLPGEIDNVSRLLPDGTSYDINSSQTNVYRGATSNLLADWAMRMWAEDLQDQIPNDIKPSTTDGVVSIENHGPVGLQRYWNPKHNPATWQHLVHYTIGYGSDAYSWPSAPHWSLIDDDTFGAGGDYSSLVNGSVTWVPNSMQNLNSNNPAELWHMAINSRGKFYPTGPGRVHDLKEAFRKILENINQENSADVTSMASSSSTNIRTDINRFVAGYDPLKWSGYVYADRIDKSGNYLAEPTWGTNPLTPPKDRRTTAQKLDELSDITSRLILTTNDISNTGVSFEWETGVTKLSASQKLLLSGAGIGQDRVNFIRGDRTKEGGVPSAPFRERTSRQGDIINSAVWYVAAPSSNFPFKGYKSFTNTQKNRLPMIYVGGNDGMLHGFSAISGDEKIAYIPKAVIPELHKLSDPSYSHRAFVDGSPMTGDVDIADRSAPTYTPDWRTMLIGTLGAGGKGYFILDVTQPGDKSGVVPSTFVKTNASTLVVMDKTLHPSAPLIPASDDEDIGHIFATPTLDDKNPYKSSQITLLNNNRWAVILGNGYNSKKERPVLLIQYLDGAKELKKIVATGNQTPSIPVNLVTDTNVIENGLSAPKIVDLNGDGKVDILYAGDLKGNLWKFDLTSTSDTNWNVADFNGTRKPLFTAIYSGKRQPISAPPSIKANDRGVGGMMVAFGTGINITDSHRTSTDVQSVYSIHDNTKYKIISGTPTINTDTADNGVTPVSVNGRSDLVEQAITNPTGISGSGVSTHRRFWNISQNNVNYDNTKGAVKKGWFLDFQTTGERVLRPLSFFDSSNNLMIYSLTPAYGGTLTNEESCEPAGTAEKAYLSLMNIMDGKKPSVQIMDSNGDGFYNQDASKDAGVSKMSISPGAIGNTINEKTITLTGSDGKIDKLARMPEQPMRPSWRQLK